jgi:hypothetical protein
MSHSHMPPAPPQARSNKGPGADPKAETVSDIPSPGNRPVPSNLAEQDRQGNIKQNTTNQGYQQDR